MSRNEKKVLRIMRKILRILRILKKSIENEKNIASGYVEIMSFLNLGQDNS